MSTLIAGTYTGAATAIASAILSGYSPATANGSTVRSALFSNGEKGVWFDPSDFSTMFQDSAGTTPVTAVGNPVGFLLDKSQGLVLGPELVTNGDFSAGSTGWTPGTGWTISGGVASVIAASGTVLRQAKTITAGKAYQIQVDITSYTAGTIYVQFSTAGSQAGPNFTSAGTKRVILIANANYANFDIAALAGTTASIDNISIKELPGYHATQPTSTARPTLASHVSLLSTTVYELVGDGVDNRLTSALSGGGTTGILLCTAIKPAVTAAATLWSDAGTNTGYKLTLDATNHIVLSAGNGTAYTSVTGPVLTAGTEYVVMAWHDGVNLNVQVNGGTITSAAFGTATAGTAGFSVMADNGTAANWFNGTVASLIYRQNDASTATDRANVLAYVNSKAGAF